MSLPDIVSKKSVAGIAVDPRTLERVIPESRRADGSVRKELKVRPGFTPQEDVSRFRGSRQQQMDRNALPKGHILGWVAPSSETKKTNVSKPGASMVSSATGEPLSKSAAKNAKRRAKKRAVGNESSSAAAKAAESEPVKDNWEDSDGEKGDSSEKSLSGQADATEGVGEATDGLTKDMQKLDLR